jgi:hypothetical protein
LLSYFIIRAFLASIFPIPTYNHCIQIIMADLAKRADDLDSEDYPYSDNHLSNLILSIHQLKGKNMKRPR